MAIPFYVKNGQYRLRKMELKRHFCRNAKKQLTKGRSGDIINKLPRKRGAVTKNFFEKNEKRY